MTGYSFIPHKEKWHVRETDYLVYLIPNICTVNAGYFIVGYSVISSKSIGQKRNSPITGLVSDVGKAATTVFTEEYSVASQRRWILFLKVYKSEIAMHSTRRQSSMTTISIK